MNSMYQLCVALGFFLQKDNCERFFFWMPKKDVDISAFALILLYALSTAWLIEIKCFSQNIRSTL